MHRRHPLGSSYGHSVLAQEQWALSITPEGKIVLRGSDRALVGWLVIEVEHLYIALKQSINAVPNGHCREQVTVLLPNAI